MKILHITTHLNIGGVARYVFDIAAGLKDNGFDVIVASGGGGLETAFVDRGIRSIQVPIGTKCEFHPKLFLAAARLRTLIERENIQVIHCHTRVSQVLGCVLARMTKRPYISTGHGYFKAGRLSRRLFPCWGDHVIAISGAVREHLINDFKLSRDIITVVNNGVDPDLYTSVSGKARDERAGQAGDPPGYLIGTVGRLSSVKGYEYLVQAFPAIRKAFPDTRLLFIGDGPEKPSLTRLCNDLDSASSVVFMPSRADAYRFYPLMDVFVLPSIQEGLGLSLLEAMASGTCVVATAAGGMRDVITHDVNGVLVPTRDAGAIARAVIALLGDKARREKMGKAARVMIRERFALKDTIRRTINVYRKVIR